uniref:Uncharacterized protein n=1 Tax=Hucho hucho TaxID=62062 RepID=A0A4W5K5E1_9TELE
HVLPLSNVGFNKSGLTMTCKIWDTASGEELHTLEGHRYVVYAIIATGSFDKTCRLWNAETGKCFHTFRGHTVKILWDVQTGGEVGHSAEIISLSFNTVGDQLVTGSFDHTVSLWDVPSGRRFHTLIGHRGEISSVQFDWDCSLLFTSSMDKSCRVWEAANEVLDVCFDYTGQLKATASADGTTTEIQPKWSSLASTQLAVFGGGGMLPMTPRTPSPPSNMEVETLCFGGVFLLRGQDNFTASKG